MIQKMKNFLIGITCISVISYIVAQIVVHDPNCDIKGIVYKNGWTETVNAGKVLMSYHHPAGFYNVCVKY